MTFSVDISSPSLKDLIIVPLVFENSTSKSIELEFDSFDIQPTKLLEIKIINERKKIFLLMSIITIKSRYMVSKIVFHCHNKKDFLHYL